MNFFKKTILLSYISIASTEAAMLTPALPTIQQYFQLSTGAVSLLMTFFLAGYMICQLMFGPLANRFGCLNALRAGFILNLLAIILGSVASIMHGYGWVLVSRFLSAMGAGVGLSGTFTLIHTLLAEKEAKASLSYVVLSFMLGIGLGVYFGGLLVQHVNWMAIWGCMFLYGLLLFLSTFLFKEPATPQIPIGIKSILNGYERCIKNGNFLAYSFVVGSINMMSQLYATAAPLISAYVLHLSADEYGKWNLLIMIGMFMGSLHGKRLISKYDTLKVLLFSLLGIFVLICTAVIGFYVSQNTLLFFTFALLLYYFGGIIYPCASYYAMKNIQDRASASGMMNFISMLTASIALIFLGYLPFGITTNFFALLIIGIGLAFLLFLFRPKINTKLLFL